MSICKKQIARGRGRPHPYITLLIFLLLMRVPLYAQSTPTPDPINTLALPAFGALTYPETWQPLADQLYAPAVQSADGTLTLRLQSGDTLETPLTVETVGKNPQDALKALNVETISAPRPIRFEYPDALPLDGLIVETKLDSTTNRLMVLTLPPHQSYWYLITLDGPRDAWKAVLPLADSLLKTFRYEPNAPLLRVVLGYDVPAGAVLRRHELAAVQIISERLAALDLGVPFTLHLLADQTLELGFYGAVEDVAAIAADVSAVGFLEIVDFSGVEQTERFENALILTSGRLAWQAAHQTSAQPTPNTGSALTHPTTNAPFETVISGPQFASAEAALSELEQWQVTIEIDEEAQPDLEAFTEAHIGEPLALVLDGRVLFIPRLQSSLKDSLVLAGFFSEAQVKQIALLVNSGPLPVMMRVETIEVLE